MRLRYFLPWYAVVPIASGILMLWLLLSLFNWLGFSHCAAWTSLPRAPEMPVRLVDAFGGRVYVRTETDHILCHEQGRWADCMGSPYPPRLGQAPDWLVNNFIAVPVAGTIVQLIRVSAFMDMTYYALLDSGEVIRCDARLDSQLVSMVRSGLVLLLILPLAALIWSLAVFLRIFILRGSPVLWDFFGRGTRIK